MAAVYTLPTPSITPTDRLGVTVFFAICAHLVVVLGVTFVKQDRSLSPANTLDVVLVQRRSEEAPEKADFLGQANQQGGGESERPLRPSTPLPSPIVSNIAEVTAASPPTELSRAVDAPRTEALAPATAPPLPPAPATPVLSQARINTEDTVALVPTRVERESPQPTPRVKATTVVESEAPDKAAPKARKQPVKRPQPTPRPQSTPQPTQTVDAASLVRRSLAMASLSAEVDRRLDAYAKRPRRKWISASTKAHQYAAYMEAWRAKVERVGNLNYPDEARRNELSGSLLLDVALKADGAVERITIRRSSGHKVLDDAAIRIVRLAAPYPRLPKNIRKETDILHIQRTWRFLSSNRFASR